MPMFPVRQAASLLGLNVVYLRKLIRADKVQAWQYVQGGRYYVDTEQVRASMERRPDHRPNGRANACWMLHVRGLAWHATRLYRLLDRERKAWVRRKCAERGIKPPKP